MKYCTFDEMIVGKTYLWGNPDTGNTYTCLYKDSNLFVVGWKVSTKDMSMSYQKTAYIQFHEIKPKITKYVNIYHKDRTNTYFASDTRRQADDKCAHDRIACVKVTFVVLVLVWCHYREMSFTDTDRLFPKKPDNPTTTLLRASRKLVQAGWTKGQYRVPGNGGPPSYCLVGALREVCEVDSYRYYSNFPAQNNYESCRGFMYRATKASSLVDWNDSPKQTKRGVLKAIDKAILLSEQSGS